MFLNVTFLQVKSRFVCMMGDLLSDWVLQHIAHVDGRLLRLVQSLDAHLI